MKMALQSQFKIQFRIGKVHDIKEKLIYSAPLCIIHLNSLNSNVVT